MKTKTAFLFCIVCSICISSYVVSAQSSVFADRLIDYQGPSPIGYDGVNKNVDPATVVLGYPDDHFLSLPASAVVTVGFSNVQIVDGPGDDIRLYEYYPGSEDAEVYIVNKAGYTVFLGHANSGGKKTFDLADINFKEGVSIIKIVGRDDEGASAGFDLDAVEALNHSNSYSNECEDYSRRIHELQEKIRNASVGYMTLVREMDDFDKYTRVNLCTKDIDHYNQDGIIEFDASWSNYLSNLGNKIGFLGRVPILSSVVSTISDGLSVLIAGLDALESKQLPLDEAWAKYSEIRTMRRQVFDNMVHALRTYYCREIFEYDRELYDLYHYRIPNSTACDAYEKSTLIQQITRNRPAGLPPIWVESNYQASLNFCNK